MTTPKNTWEFFDATNEFVYNITKDVFNNDGVRREILRPGKAQFDLIIVDIWKYDAFYSLAAYFEAPIIGLAPCGIDWKIDEMVGNPSPMSYLQSPSSYLYNLDTFGVAWHTLWKSPFLGSTGTGVMSKSMRHFTKSISQK